MDRNSYLELDDWVSVDESYRNIFEIPNHKFKIVRVNRCNGTYNLQSLKDSSLLVKVSKDNVIKIEK